MAEFDIIIYGATGFTGRLVAEYMNATHPNRPWAMAGRSAEKLAQVRDEMSLPADTAMVVADASDPASIEAMGRACRRHHHYGWPLSGLWRAAGFRLRRSRHRLCRPVG